jgi:hypothetical protein
MAAETSSQCYPHVFVRSASEIPFSVLDARQPLVGSSERIEKNVYLRVALNQINGSLRSGFVCDDASPDFGMPVPSMTA